MPSSGEIIHFNQIPHKGFDIVANGARYGVIWSHFVIPVLRSNSTSLEIRTSTHRFTVTGRNLGFLYEALMKDETLSYIAAATLTDMGDREACVIQTIGAAELD